MTGTTPDGTPKDDNGSGRWRLQNVERNLNQVTSEVRAMALAFAVHQAQTNDFIARTDERHRNDLERRRDREKMMDDRLAEQDAKIARFTTIARWALAALATMILGVLANALILLNQGGS